MAQPESFISASLPNEEEQDEYIEVVIDNGPDMRDRFAVVFVDDAGRAHTVAAGVDRKGNVGVVDVFEGRPKPGVGRRIEWHDLPGQYQGLIWSQFEELNGSS
ncbi:hypothetical protein NCG89_15065 [Spongiibacter taiwanensis]|uniref:hypothetical protein n=1 Tax=Spongiibacter taiwanensis TaxID=1748242 RepID=UPI002035A2BD|nr:hypothetical protein [Spongiibacter taiwanensis]USA42852.1 hypothetical protein NCG89_15065 [Spongiibacter taiwanensis]